MHVYADQNVCATSGHCVAIVPEVFAERAGDGVVVVQHPRPPVWLWREVRDAARRCPVAAISVAESAPR